MTKDTDETDQPLSETIIPKIKDATKEECIKDLRIMAVSEPDRVISRNYYRIHGKYAESAWSVHFGTFHEFKRQSGIILTRQQHKLEREIAKHASVDHYRSFQRERSEWGDKYIRPNSNRYKSILVASDLHDIEVDKFYLRVLIDTAKRVQPDVIVLNGDVFDLPEFGRYTVDPRDWDVVNRIKFVHDNILNPIREVCPDSQIDLIEGNHELRLLKHMADATPALKAVLSDLHGMTIGKLLGLEKYEINYIAKADMASWNQRDIQKELGNNYKVYYESVLCHHYPYGRNMGLPGVNGHHHSHHVWSMFSPVYGAYEWQQIGAGHKRSASYTEGEKWHNGFVIVNVDTKTRSTNFDYIPITDFAVSGGKWYTRNENEFDDSVPKKLLMGS